MAVLLLGGLVNSQNISQAEQHLNEYYRLRLYNDSVTDWNTRTRTAWVQNNTYTVERGNCTEEQLIHNYNLGYDLIDDPLVDYRGVEVPENIFNDKCGVLYVSEPIVYNGYANITWVQGNTVSLSVGVGCTTRTVNGTWDNPDPESPNGGYHKEYLLPVYENTIVFAGDQVCFNETIIHGEGGYPKEVDSLRMLQINCSLKDPTTHVQVKHTCEGKIILDSAYQVMGYIVNCDTESIKTVLDDRCNYEKCSGILDKDAMKACNHACSSYASREVKNVCQPRRSQKVDCPTPASSTYGVPEDGSSSYHITLPKFNADYCRKYCDEKYDPSNICSNNIVKLQSSEAYVCRQSQNFTIKQDSTYSCSGEYYVQRGGLAGSISLSSRPYDMAGVVFGDSVGNFLFFEPRHELYRMHNESLNFSEHRAYSIFENDYEIKTAHNDSGYFDFTYFETIYDTQYLAEAFYTINNLKQNGITINFSFTAPNTGNLSAENLSIITFEDRFDLSRTKSCATNADCGNGSVCVDLLCLDLSKLNTTVPLSCLKMVNLTSLILSSPYNAEAGQDVELSGTLTSYSTPLKGMVVEVSCSPNNLSVLKNTDEDGRFRLNFTMDSGRIVCTAKYAGDNIYKESEGLALIRLKTIFSDYIVILGVFTVLGFFAVLFSVAEGGRSIHDFYEEFRGFFR